MYSNSSIFYSIEAFLLVIELWFSKYFCYFITWLIRWRFLKFNLVQPFQILGVYIEGAAAARHAFLILRLFYKHPVGFKIFFVSKAC